MKLSFLPTEKIITINGKSVTGVTTDISWVPSDVYAVFWDDNFQPLGISTGHIQYNDGKHQVGITTTGIYWQAVTDHANEIQMISDAREAARDHLAEVKSYRNALLAWSDWTQFNDSPLSSSKKTEWATYRQALRDIPATIAGDSNLTAKIMADDHTLSTWPTQPS